MTQTMHSMPVSKFKDARLFVVQALVATDTPGLRYMDLLRMLTGPVYSQSAALPHKQAYCSIAKCVAALTRACPTEGPAVVGQFIQVRHTQRLCACCVICRRRCFDVMFSLSVSGRM